MSALTLAPGPAAQCGHSGTTSVIYMTTFLPLGERKPPGHNTNRRVDQTPLRENFGLIGREVCDSAQRRDVTGRCAGAERRSLLPDCGRHAWLCQLVAACSVSFCSTSSPSIAIWISSLTTIRPSRMALKLSPKFFLLILVVAP